MHQPSIRRCLIVATLALAAGAPSASAAGGLLGPKALDLPALRSVFQARVQGTCAPAGAVQGIGRKGKLQCTKPVPVVQGITTSGGLTGGGTGGVALGTDPDVLQSRIGGACDAQQAIQGVNRDGTVKCVGFGTGAGSVTSVGSGFGLTGGPITGSGSLAADPTVLQRRVADTCAAGHALRSITQDGTVGCDPFVGAVTAGDGLLGGKITDTGTLSVDPTAVQSRITNSCTGRETIQTVKQDGSVTCQASGTGSVSSVGSGFGLTGGPITDTGSLAVDPTAVQDRVTGTCTGKQTIQAVAQDGSVTCQAPNPGTVTSVGSGFGLTGGPVTDTGSLAVDPTAVQKRVTGICTGNQSLQSILQDGTATCRSFVTGVTAGTGLTGGAISSSGTLAVDPAAVQSRVTGTCANNQAVQGVNQAGTVSCSPALEPATKTVSVQRFLSPDNTAVTLLDTNGAKVSARCVPGNPGHIDIILESTSGQLDYGFESKGTGSDASVISPGSPVTVGSTTTFDSVRITAFQNGAAPPIAGTLVFANSGNTVCPVGGMFTVG